MKKPSGIEKLESHPVAQGAVSLLSAFHPVGAILPALLSCAANARMQTRVEEAIVDLERKISLLTDNVSAMNDAQFKFVCDAMSDLYRTNDPNKIEYLKNAVINGVINNDLTYETSYIANRILRDISALELDFLVKSMAYKRIFLNEVDQDGGIPITDHEAWNQSNSLQNKTIVNGLRSLGLIEEDGTWNAGYVLTPIAHIVTKMVS